MKKIFALAASLLFTQLLFAQDEPLTKGDLKLNVGLGLGSIVKAAGGRTSFPPLTASLEYAVGDNFTVGPVVGYTAVEEDYEFADLDRNYNVIYRTTTFRTSNLLVGARGSYYFNVNPRFDLYAGGILCYDVVSTKVLSGGSSLIDESDFASDYPSIVYSFHGGGRYKFSPNTAAFAELGYGIAILNIGITFSLGKK